MSCKNLNVYYLALYAENIMRNAGLEETHAGIKISRRNINNLRYADDMSLMAESEEELKSLLMKVKEESEKVGLKLNSSVYSCHLLLISSASVMSIPFRSLIEPIFE